MYEVVRIVLMAIEAIIFANGIDKYIKLRKEDSKYAVAALIPVPIAFGAILYMML